MKLSQSWHAITILLLLWCGDLLLVSCQGQRAVLTPVRLEVQLSRDEVDVLHRMIIDEIMVALQDGVFRRNPKYAPHVWLEGEIIDYLFATSRNSGKLRIHLETDGQKGQLTVRYDTAQTSVEETADFTAQQLHDFSQFLRAFAPEASASPTA